jgi:hypothetical protein
MSDINPPIYRDRGPAPTGVCCRWMGTSPCGAAGSHHVIWDSNLTNGCVCASHVAEIRQRWVYIGLHPYTADCVAFTDGEAEWDASKDRCERPQPITLAADAMSGAASAR